MLGTIVAIICNAKSNEKAIRAVCDSGSQISLISIDSVHRLGLKISKSSIKLIGAQDIKIGQVAGKVMLAMGIPNSDSILHCLFYVVPRISRPLPETKIQQDKYLQRLQLADPNYGMPSEIDALFGIDIWLRILLPNIIYNIVQSAGSTFARKQRMHK